MSRRSPGSVVRTPTGTAVRSAGSAVGWLAVVVLPAITLGAVAVRLAPHDATVTAALCTTTVTALLGGLAAGRPLRLRQRPYAHPTPGTITNGGAGGERAPAGR
ncbi:hypothetical protein ACLQ2S_24705 [Micromonospora sp. DT48]|uniref:hypothetical protein n=1 Tax=Micromonospora sp. DT48 TaxID=3393429 RepID=UPI003CEF7D36